MTLQGKAYTIIIEDGRFDRTDEVADAMKGSGMAIRSVMRDTGVIFAVLDETQAAAVRAMDGVLQAEPGKTAHILA